LPTNRQRLPVFDLLRALAALLVFLFHYSGFTAPRTHGSQSVDTLEWMAANLGSIGTNLLLLLSGYFSAHSMASERFTYGRFVALRIARIYIPFVAVLSLAIAFSYLVPQYARVPASEVSWPLIGSHLVLLPGIYPKHPMLTLTWALSYIVAGYLALPLLAVAARWFDARRSARIQLWTAVAILCYACGLAGWSMIRFTYIPVGCLVWELQAGLAPSAEQKSLLLRVLTVGLASMTVRLLLQAGLIDGGGSPLLLQRGLLTASGLLAVASLVSAGLLLQKLDGQWQSLAPVRHFALLGRAGYSFYLLHGPVVKLFSLVVFPVLVSHAAPAAAYWCVMPVCWALSAAAATLLYRSLEVPCRNWLMAPTAAPDPPPQPSTSGAAELARALASFHSPTARIPTEQPSRRSSPAAPAPPASTAQTAEFASRDSGASK
jgi:peptidoglycan/LPS O-acetylase OafA/YrhL